MFLFFVNLAKLANLYVILHAYLLCHSNSSIFIIIDITRFLLNLAHTQRIFFFMLKFQFFNSFSFYLLFIMAVLGRFIEQINKRKTLKMKKKI